MVNENCFKYFQRARVFTKEFVGDGCRIHANDEVWALNPDYSHAEGFGNNNDDLTASYLHSMSSFIQQWPACIIAPWCITDKKAYNFRWYITEGNERPGTYQQHYGVANGEFMKWLFIDDGAGNVINTEGVLYRNDALTSGIFTYGKYIIKDNIIDDDGETVIIKNTDHIYMYPGCPDTVTSNRVYCGD